MAHVTLRRLRQNRWTRELSRSVHLDVSQFIQPHFVVEGLSHRQPVPGLTGVYRETPDSLIRQVEDDLEKGVRKVLLFGVPAQKHEKMFDHGFSGNQIASLRERFGKDLWIAADVCLCSHTVHGQCGILNDTQSDVDNQSTVPALAQQALCFSQAGADCVAPSDMMDGRVGAIRQTLDQGDQHTTLIMSYSAKFHSRYYGPFRTAADSSPKGDIAIRDRATYQIDPGAPNDAFLSSVRDMEEGADILMVKPGLPYLDVLSWLSREIPKPWAVYEVSGEFASVECMGKENLMDAPSAHLEAWTAFVRSGASMIISYGSRFAQQWLSERRM